VSEPGAVFGELSILLNQPHTADVLTLESSEFHVASESLLAEDQLASIYLAMVLAKRVNNANRALVELKHQLHAGEPHSVIAETLAEIECNLIYAGYPFNPISRQRTSASFPKARRIAANVAKLPELLRKV
jgi:CRP/FNR family transcriptional regulator, cyclic AMP receptor protein